MNYEVPEPSTSHPGAGRRGRNKSEKLVRITIAARQLLAAKGVANVTTAEVALAADVAAGTLFLYAKNKGELILLAQNADYQTALADGISASDKSSNVLEALHALWAPVFICNRKNIENGRAYLREVMFGDPGEPNHGEALNLMSSTEVQTAKIIAKFSRVSARDAEAKAQLISSAAYVILSSPVTVPLHLEELMKLLISQAELVVK
jgi:TetR/AcrR family transcriptional regulator